MPSAGLNFADLRFFPTSGTCQEEEVLGHPSVIEMAKIARVISET